MNIYNQFCIFLYYSKYFEKYYLKKKEDINCIQFFKVIKSSYVILIEKKEESWGMKWSLILRKIFELKKGEEDGKELCEIAYVGRPGYETTCTYVSEMKRSLSREDLELGDLSVRAFGIRGM